MNICSINVAKQKSTIQPFKILMDAEGLSSLKSTLRQQPDLRVARLKYKTKLHERHRPLLRQCQDGEFFATLKKRSYS